MINLATVEPRIQEKAAGATVNDAKSLIFEYAWMLKKQGYREGTIREYANQIALLKKYGADIFNPESVKSVLAQASWKESTKAVITKIYSNFLSFHNLTWHEPTYKQRKTLKFIPTEKEINDLISCCGKITSLALRIAKETGARIGEIAKLRWIDIDREKRILRISEAEKGSNPRILSISNDLIALSTTCKRKANTSS